MDEPTQLATTAERLAVAAEALTAALLRFDEQQQALTTKIDRIVAAIDDRSSDDETRRLRERLVELERDNAELKAQAGRALRKTLPPLVSALLAKNGLAESDTPARLDPALLDTSLSSLSLEQRIAVKAEMARAGMIE